MTKYKFIKEDWVLKEINYGLFTDIIKLQLDTNDDNLLKNSIAIVAKGYGKKIDEVGKLNKAQLVKLHNELCQKQSEIIISKTPIKEFEFNQKKYLVDASILQGNVTFLSDYDTINKMFNKNDKQYELIKHIAALAIYEDGISMDEYSTERYQKHLFLIDRLPPEIPIGVANFFLLLLNLYSQLTKEYSEAQNMMKILPHIITEQ